MAKLLGKRGIVADYLPWIIIAVAVLAVLMFSIYLMKNTGVSMIDKIKGLLRLG